MRRLSRDELTICTLLTLGVSVPIGELGIRFRLDLKSTTRWLRLLASLTRYDLTAFNTQSVTIGL